MKAKNWMSKAKNKANLIYKMELISFMLIFNDTLEGRVAFQSEVWQACHLQINQKTIIATARTTQWCSLVILW